MAITYDPQSYQLQKNMKWVASGMINTVFNNGFNGEVTSVSINDIYFDTEDEANEFFSKFCEAKGYKKAKIIK